MKTPFNRIRRSAMALGAGLAVALTASTVVAQEAGKGPRQAMSLLLLPAVLLAIGPLQAILAMLFPRWTAAMREAVETRRGLCLGWGLAIAVLAFLILWVGAAAEGPIAVLAGVIDLFVILVGAFGFVGVATAAGARLLPSGSSAEDRAPLQALIGGSLLSFAMLAPLLGQLLALLALLAALGAAARALVTGGKPATDGGT